MIYYSPENVLVCQYPAKKVHKFHWKMLKKEQKWVENAQGGATLNGGAKIFRTTLKELEGTDKKKKKREGRKILTNKNSERENSG